MKPRIIKAVAALAIFTAATVQGVVPTNFISFKPFMGLAYSPFRGSESPNYYTYPSVADITYDLTNNLIYLASEIETYGMDGTLSNIPALCNQYNLKCYPCAFLSPTNLAENNNEMYALINVGNQNFPTTRGLVVGTEAVFDGYDVNTLINNINYIRAATSNTVPVGTRDVPQIFQNNPSLVAACDFIQVDIYAYWAQMPIEQAATWTIQEWQQIASQYPGKRVEIGEANWPTGGTNSLWTDYSVVVNQQNQSVFLSQFVPLANSNGIEYFIFDFRDETWKQQDGYGTVETNWGIVEAYDYKKLGLLNYLSAGFSLKIHSTNASHANIVIPTYEGDPYFLDSTGNLLDSPGNIAAVFWGAPGTNRTVFTVTNSGLPGIFFRVAQDF
jgi:exo-beta-1,3-glucanase (GH17 family)